MNFLLLLSTCAIAWAGPAEQKQEAQNLYQKGAYAQSIKLAEKIPGSEAAMLLASAHAKLQSFDKALPYYKAAEAAHDPSANLAYDYGQALFATHNLSEAESQFKKSIVGKFKISASAYYIGYIRQLQEDAAGAKDFYQRIQRLAGDSDQVKQPALYQLAELEYDRIANEPKAHRLRLLDTEVLPLYRKARDFARGTPTFDEAVTKITAIERELSEVTQRMANGNPLPIKPYTLRVSEEMGYDSNVITEADDALLQVSNKDALISRSALLARYQFNFRRRFSVMPELNASLTMHSRRSTPRVYQNDNIVIAPALRNKWEHMSRGKAATGLFDVEYNLMLRDYAQQHHFPYYTRTLNFLAGERVNWFATGSTTVKLGMKFTENYNPDRNAYSPQFYFQQNVKIAGAYDLQNVFTADYLHARDDVNDERNYKLRHSTTIPRIYEKIDLTPLISFNLKDTMKQKATRGNELLASAGFTLNRDFGRIEGAFDYAYSKNYSKSKDQYEYSKHELKIGAGYRF